MKNHNSKQTSVAHRILAVVLALSLWAPVLPAQAPPGRPASTGQAEQMTSLIFRDAPIDQVLGFYAELTGRTMIKAPGINVQITLRGQTRLTKSEAMQAIESVLAMNNVVLVPMGEKFFKVVQIGGARQEGLPISKDTPGENGFPESDHLVSQIVNLQFLEISEVQPILQPLLHGYGKIQPLERTNSLLITDTSGNLQRIIEVLAEIDKPATSKVETRIYEIRYAEAGKIAARLNELIAQSQEQQKENSSAPKTQQAEIPRGVIRARQSNASTSVPTAQEMAEQGIIQGTVKVLADDRTNILIVISPPYNYAFFDRIVAVLDRKVEPDITVKVYALEYADAEEISGVLNEFVGAATGDKTSGAAGGDGEATSKNDSRSQALREYINRQKQASGTQEGKSDIGQLSESTKILADKRTNSLLLMGRKSDIAALMDVITELDRMLAQVLIETVILEVSLSKGLSYGMDWLQRSMTAYNETVKGPGPGVSIRQPVMSFGGGWAGASGTTFQDASQIDRSANLSGGALTYYLTLFDLNIDAIIRMAANSSDARVLSTPVVLTTDNTEAKIVAGEERPIVTSTSTSDGGTQTSRYEYKNIGIELTVTPRINPNRTVVMEVEQTADNVGELVQIDGNDVPVITKRELSASIAVADRTSIVLGGLINSSGRKSRTKVPLLGDIPLLGALFRSEERSKNKSELLVLMTPYVLLTPEEAQAQTQRLHDSSSARNTKWYNTWSDSDLARRLRAEDKSKGFLGFGGKKKGEAVELSKGDVTPRISYMVPSDMAMPTEKSAEIQEDASPEPVSEDVGVKEPAPELKPPAVDAPDPQPDAEMLMKPVPMR